MLPRLSLLGFGHKTGEGQCGPGEASLRARGSKAGGSRGGGKGSAETKMKEMQMETRSEQAEVNQVVSVSFNRGTAQSWEATLPHACAAPCCL